MFEFGSRNAEGGKIIEGRRQMPENRGQTTEFGRGKWGKRKVRRCEGTKAGK